MTVKCCYVLHVNSKKFTEATITSLSSLCQALGLVSAVAIDEFVRLRVSFPEGFTLSDVSWMSSILFDRVLHLHISFYQTTWLWKALFLKGKKTTTAAKVKWIVKLKIPSALSLFVTFSIEHPLKPTNRHREC